MDKKYELIAPTQGHFILTFPSGQKIELVDLSHYRDTGEAYRNACELIHKALSAWAGEGAGQS